MLQGRHRLLLRLIINAILVSFALVLSYLESFIPLNYLFIVPGLKLGLANIPVMYSLYILSIKDGLTVAILKIAITALLFGSPVSFIFSLVGTLFALIIMILLKKFYTLGKITFIGVSCASAVGFNIGQLVAAMLVFGSLSPIIYIPSLIIGGAVFGIICGFVLNSVTALLKGKILI
jgi:heptaprenyl diphosphate synthase